MAVIAVFVAGLMVGRTPEYLGKKIEAKEVKFAMLAVLILPLSILGFTAVAAVLPVALKAPRTPARTASEILYAYSSATGNNGSAFAASREHPLLGRHDGLAMLLGRFRIWSRCWRWPARSPPRSSCRFGGTFPTDSPLFVGLPVGVILIMGGLQFFPALALGPIVEQRRCWPDAEPLLGAPLMTSR